MCAAWVMSMATTASALAKVTKGASSTYLPTPGRDDAAEGRPSPQSSRQGTPLDLATSAPGSPSDESLALRARVPRPRV